MYETELYEFIIDSICMMFDINKEDKAYKYLKLRYLIYNLDLKKKEANRLKNNFLFAMFVMSELNIPLEDGNIFVFKGKEMSIYKEIPSVIENWEFRASLIPEHLDLGTSQQLLSLDTFIDEVFIYITEKANSKANKMATNEVNKDIYMKYYGLKYLNDFFNIVPVPPKVFLEIEYGPNHNPYKRTLEEELNALVHSIEFMSNNTKLITEEDLEDYLVLNLEKIEEGMSFVGRQVAVEGGIIDILAKDKNNILSIIELKTDTNKDLIWQCLYYPEAIKKEYKTNKVRMITLSPEYKQKIKNVLLNIKDIELMKYDLFINNRKIKDIKIFADEYCELN